ASASSALPCHRSDLRSFPTRRSSDLACRGDGRGKIGFTRAPFAGGDAIERGDHEPDGIDRQTCGIQLIKRVDNRDGNDQGMQAEDRKSTRLNSSHVKISYAVFCLKKK